jgi:hypothetical protein
MSSLYFLEKILIALNAQICKERLKFNYIILGKASYSYIGA